MASKGHVTIPANDTQWKHCVGLLEHLLKEKGSHFPPTLSSLLLCGMQSWWIVTWQPLGPWGKLENGSHVFNVAEETVKNLGPWWHRYVCMYVLVAQSCLTFCDPMDCSLPGSSIRGIFQTRILEWVAISFSRRSSWPRDWTWVSCIVGRCFTIWATREVQMCLWLTDILLKCRFWLGRCGMGSPVMHV